MIARFDLDTTQPEWALGYQLGHRAARARRDAHGGLMASARRRPRRSGRSSPSGCPSTAASGVVGRPDGDLDHRHGATTATASPSSTRWSRSGRRTAHGRYRHPEDTREELPLEDGFDGFGRCGTDASGEFRSTRQAGRRAGGRTAPHINVIVLARGLLQAPRHADLLPRRGGGERGRPGAVVDRGSRDARHADRAATRPAVRHPPPGRAARPRSLTSDGLFTPIFVPEAVQDAVSDAAWLRAMLDVEARARAGRGARRA